MLIVPLFHEELDFAGKFDTDSIGSSFFLLLFTFKLNITETALQDKDNKFLVLLQNTTSNFLLKVMKAMCFVIV